MPGMVKGGNGQCEWANMLVIAERVEVVVQLLEPRTTVMWNGEERDMDVLSWEAQRTGRVRKEGLRTGAVPTCRTVPPGSMKELNKVENDVTMGVQISACVSICTERRQDENEKGEILVDNAEREMKLRIETRCAGDAFLEGGVAAGGDREMTPGGKSLSYAKGFSLPRFEQIKAFQGICFAATKLPLESLITKPIPTGVDQDSSCVPEPVGVIS
nr:hypothetical protein Iba_chr13cCG1050 [Ipomoea batatas]